tara:strand:+ start:8666 stop:9184 length:519 start_codon:yes stop_codon:yes gene_type:complete
MTTVIVDAKRKVAYSDSRSTYTVVKTGEETFKSNATKIHKHKSGKLLAVSFGNYNISVIQLQKLGFKVSKKDRLIGRDFVSNSTDSAGILIFGKDSERIVHYRSIAEDSTLKVVWRSKLLEGCNRAWAGSGMDTGIPERLFSYKDNFPYDKIIKACSLVDPYTDDKVQMKKL